MDKIKNAFRVAYRFKPGRTFAQALAATLVVDAATTGIFDVDLAGKAAVALSAGAASFFMIWGEGGNLLADDARVTHTKPETPVVGA